MPHSQEPIPFFAALTLGVPLAIVFVVLFSTQPSCKNAAQAENAIFTTEQLLCMVVPLADGLLEGTPEEIAADIVKACPTLEGFTTEVVTFVNQWIKGSPVQRERWRAFAASSRKGPKIFPVPDAAPAGAR